jgi:purine-binding chemotaxis protein CheW
MNSEPALTNLENPAGQRHLVTFRLDQQTYALPIEPIGRILEMVAITPIPQIQRPVAGVINVQGAAVPVVDMRQHFGLPEAPWQLDTHIILSQINGRVVGLIVDEVIDVLDLPADQITPPADILPEELGEAPLLQGLAHVPGGTVLVLNLAHLFRPSQTRALAQAAAALPELVEELSEESLAAPEPQEPDAKAPPQPEATAAKDAATAEKASEAAPPKPARTRRRKRSSRKAQPEATAAKDAAAEEKTPEAAPAQPARTRRKRRSSRKAQDVAAVKAEEIAKETAEAASPQPARTRRKRRAPRKAPDAAAAKDADTAPEAKAPPDQEVGEGKA